MADKNKEAEAKAKEEAEAKAKEEAVAPREVKAKTEDELRAEVEAARKKAGKASLTEAPKMQKAEKKEKAKREPVKLLKPSEYKKAKALKDVVKFRSNRTKYVIDESGRTLKARKGAIIVADTDLALKALEAEGFKKLKD